MLVAETAGQTRSETALNADLPEVAFRREDDFVVIERGIAIVTFVLALLGEAQMRDEQKQPNRHKSFACGNRIYQVLEERNQEDSGAWLKPSLTLGAPFQDRVTPSTPRCARGSVSGSRTHEEVYCRLRGVL